MEQLKNMKEQLTAIVQGQLAHTDCVDTKELGEAVDMIKDLAEAIYYCSITEAMEDSTNEKNGGNTYYYTVPTMPYDDYNRGRMYYGGGQGGGSYGQGSGGNNSSSGSNNGGGQTSYYTPRNSINPVYYTPDMYRERPWDMGPEFVPHDPREGRARQSRRMYMESKEMHKDQGTQMKELEKYIRDLSDDITEMIANATPEEKQVLQQKIATLSTKIK